MAQTERVRLSPPVSCSRSSGWMTLVVWALTSAEAVRPVYSSVHTSRKAPERRTVSSLPASLAGALLEFSNAQV